MKTCENVYRRHVALPLCVIRLKEGAGGGRKGRWGRAVLPRPIKPHMYTTKADAPFTASGPEGHPV